jgi:glycyl-tRNA synthetase beta subunit
MQSNFTKWLWLDSNRMHAIMVTERQILKTLFSLKHRVEGFFDYAVHVNRSNGSTQNLRMQDIQTAKSIIHVQMASF